MPIRTTLRLHLNQPEWQRSTKQLTANASRPWGKGTPHLLLVGLKIAAVITETGVWNSQKDKNKSTIQPSTLALVQST